MTGERRRADGRGLPGDPRGAAARRGDGQARGGALRARRSISAWRRIREYHRAPRAATRRDGGRRPVPVHALRHVRIPAGPGPGGVPGRRLAVRPESLAVRGGDGGPARARARAAHRSARRAAADAGRRIYQQLSTELGSTEFLGYDGAEPRPRAILAIVDEGRRRRGGERGRDRRGPPRPHAGLCRVGRPDGRHRPDRRPRGAGATIEDTYYRGAQLIVHRVRSRRACSGGRRGRGERRVAPPRRGCASTTPARTCCTRRCAGCSAPTWARRGSLVAPDHLRFDFSHGAGLKDNEVEQVEQLVNEQVQANVVVSPSEMDLQDALKSRRHGALRREVRRPRPGHPHRRLLDRAVRRHAPRRHRRDRTLQGRERRRGGVRRPAHRGGDGRGRAPPRRPAGGRAPRVGEPPQDPPLELPQRLQKLLDEQKQLEKQLAHLEARLARSRAQELASSAVEVGRRAP